jgi:hypothetical protein
MFYVGKYLRCSLIDGKYAGCELSKSGESDIKLAPVGQVHAFESSKIKKNTIELLQKLYKCVECTVHWRFL